MAKSSIIAWPIAFAVVFLGGCGKRGHSDVPQSYSISDLESVVIDVQERLAEGKLPRDTVEMERVAKQFAKSVAGSSFETEATAVSDKVAAVKRALASSPSKASVSPAVNDLVATVAAVRQKLEKP